MKITVLRFEDLTKFEQSSLATTSLSSIFFFFFKLKI